MSKKSPAQRSVYAALQHIGGARSTKTATRRTCFQFIEFCTLIGQPLKSIKTPTLEQVQKFIDDKRFPTSESKKKALSTAVLHNMVAQIRVCVHALHGKPDTIGITAQTLGLPARSRKGTKLPITDQVFFNAVATARALGEIGFAIAISLERYLGHRCQEALMTGEGVKNYVAELQDLLRVSRLDLGVPSGCVLPEVEVQDGTKGNRPRTTVSILKYTRETLEVLLEAVQYLQTHPFLVQGKAAGLKASRARAQYLAKKCGLTSQYSQHSCRYRYACDKLEEYRDAGMNRNDAFKLVTKHLGHGPSRASAMIAGVYGQTVAKTFAKMPKKRDLTSQIESLQVLFNSVYGPGETIKPPDSPSANATS